MKFSTRRLNEWLIVLLILIAVPILFAFTRNGLNLLPYDFHYLFNVHPTTNILGLATVDAINIFGGRELQGYVINWHTISIFLNVVLYLMIGPYLFYKGYKKAKDNPNRSKPWYWYIGGAFCIGAILIVPVEIIHMKVFENTKEGADKGRAEDMMRIELVEVGFATAQYEILENGVNESFKIEDLDLNDLNFDHKVESFQSDTLLIISVSNPDLPDEDIKIEVRPYSESVLRIRN